MKKLLVLILVLGLASAANANILELSIGGVTNGAGVQQEITIAPSDELVIDVYNSQGTGVDSFWLELIGPGSFAGTGTVNIPPAPSNGFAIDDTTYAGWIEYSANATTTPTGIGSWLDIQFHCDGEGDVVINLYDGNGAVIEDSILIHQVIPEPMTIALLGLGGLFLRRRKHA